MYEDRRPPFASIQDLKEAIKNKRSPLRQFENPFHNHKRRSLCTVGGHIRGSGGRSPPEAKRSIHTYVYIRGVH